MPPRPRTTWRAAKASTATFRSRSGWRCTGLPASLARGDIPRAHRLFEEALAILREQSAQPRDVALLLVALGDLAREGGDPAQARARLGDALDQATVLGNRTPLIATLEAIGVLAITVSENAVSSPEDSVRLFGAAAALRSSTRLAPPAAMPVQQASSRARLKLGANRVDTLFAAGRRLSVDDAIKLGQSVLASLECRRRRTGTRKGHRSLDASGKWPRWSRGARRIDRSRTPS
jgi:hypothetical protein